MARQKPQKKQEPASEEVEDVEEEDLDSEQFDGFEEDYNDYVSRAELKEELKAKITGIEGDKKIAFAAMFELYGKQQEIDDEEEKEIDAIKHKYRMKTEQLLNRARKIVDGESTENNILENSEILDAQ